MIQFHLIKDLNFLDGNSDLDIKMEIPSKSFSAIYGPSGAGKTTILKMISGLVEPREGQVFLNNKVVFDKASRINVKPYDRNIGYVFQDNALFPNFTVEENLSYALENKKDSEIIERLIKLFEIDFLRNKSIGQLSGGQKQRVNIARALVRRPEILLMDEPFSSLDDETRGGIQEKLLEIHTTFELTSIIVSHQKEEVIKLCDKVFVIESGKIVSQGTPKILLHRNGVIFQGIVTEILCDQNKNSLLISGDNGKITVPLAAIDIEKYTLGQEIIISANKLKNLTSSCFNPIS